MICLDGVMMFLMLVEIAVPVSQWVTIIASSCPSSCMFSENEFFLCTCTYFGPLGESTFAVSFVF